MSRDDSTPGGGFWREHFERLQKSLIAQIERIRAGSKHSTIKGTSIEVVLRRTLREYLPEYFSVGSGQIANHHGLISPQQDVLIYDANAFPHLTVNEDGSVVVCCESLLASVECKVNWNQGEVEEHYERTIAVESQRCQPFSGEDMQAAYLVVFHEKKRAPHFDTFKKKTRVFGAYCMGSNETWSTQSGSDEFSKTSSPVLELFFRDLLRHCMHIGQIEVGSLGGAYHVVGQYLGWAIPPGDRGTDG